jgi:antitoxin MazE
MKTTLHKIGNAQGVLIPQAMLTQAGIDNEAEISLENGVIILRKPEPAVRVGWADASQEIAMAGDDVLVWPEFANEPDAELEW